jgi:hypothetical protein
MLAFPPLPPPPPTIPVVTPALLSSQIQIIIIQAGSRNVSPLRFFLR